MREESDMADVDWQAMEDEAADAAAQAVLAYGTLNLKPNVAV